MKLHSPEYEQLSLKSKIRAILKEVNDGLAISPAYIESMVEEVLLAIKEDNA